MSKIINSYEQLEETVHEKFKELGFTNIEISFQNGSNAGDGYLSDIVRAKISGDRNGTHQDIDTIIKRATKDSKVRAHVPTAGTFKREIFFYTKIVPTYEKLQEDFGIEDDLKVRFPKCYAVNEALCDEFIILENLKSQDFKMTERLKLDVAHGYKAIDTLARLHALSYVFQKTYPKKFEEILEEVNEVLLTSGDEEYNPSMFKEYLKKCFRKALMSTKDQNHKRRLHKAVKNVYDLTVTLVKGGECPAILHGDYWTNNIFYNYKNGEPNELIPYDYQLVRYASPVLDLSILLFCNTDTDFRRDHYQLLLDRYHNSLGVFLKQFHYDVEEVYPNEVFWKEVSKYSIYGLCFAFLFMMTVLQPCGENEGLLELWNKDDIYEENPVCDKRINDLVVDCVAYGYI